MQSTIEYKGLTETQVQESRRKYGSNVLTPPPRKPLWKQFFETFNDPLIKILLAALALSLLVSGYEYVSGSKGTEVILEPLGIACAILLATLVGFLVEANANKKFDILNKINDDVMVKVLRNGQVTQVARRDIVLGDIVLVDAGEKIPADGELLDSVSLSVNESSFTGESHARHKSHLNDFEDEDSTYPCNVLLRGSSVSEGHGMMRVTSVGDATEYGKIYTDAQIEHDLDTPLMRQFDKLGKYISLGSYVAAVLIFLGRFIAFFLDYGSAFEWLGLFEYFVETLMLAVTLIVVSVPEGLPMAVTLSLALSMHRMLQSKNLVRKMHACETMGATTVICTDKTGTLTRNQMQVNHTHFPALGAAQRLSDDEASAIVAHNMACNATAHLARTQGEGVKVLGNPTEGALLEWLQSQGIDYQALRNAAVVEMQLPFSTENKLMATVVRSKALGNRRVLLVKGASEIIYKQCSGVAGGVDFSILAAELLDYQSMAMRTLGFAYKILDEGETPIAGSTLQAQGMTFLGIVAISDPVRDDVPAAIKECTAAGIQVKIVTGDTPGTAREIGRQVGLWAESDGDDALILGEDFAALSDEEAAQRARQIKIMSRARPADKARLVHLLQRENEVVAVTGDGTNDAPALNAAQVGLSMGDGTAVAKEASDITIIDNSFASIVKAVMWGRSLYKNILRFIIFQLTVNVAACLLVGFGSFLTDKVPVLTVTQMLWVNLIMDTFAALALASLPPSADVMHDSPRGNSLKIFTSGMKWFVGFFGVSFFLVMFVYFKQQLDGGVMDMEERTMFFTTFVALQFWNIFNAKSFDSGHTAFYKLRESKIFFMVVAVILLGQWLIVQFGGVMFQTTPLPLADFALIFLYTAPVMLIPQFYQLIHPNK